jgi:cardiolipin synthase
LWVTSVVVSRDVILLLGPAVAHFSDSRVALTPPFLGKGTTLLQLAYVVMVIFLSSRHIDLTLTLPLLIGMVSFTLLSGLHYLYRGIRHTSAISG